MVEYRISKNGEMHKNDEKVYNEDDYVLRINMGNGNIPIGCIPKQTDYSYEGEEYCLTTSLSNIKDFDLIYKEKIIMNKSGKKYCIYSPFNDLLSVANEIAITLLDTSKVLTLHCAAAFNIIEKELVLFCGESNSGKTSTMNEICNNQVFSPVADDHIHLMFKEGEILYSIPIWDKYCSEDDEIHWIKASKLKIVSIGKRQTIKKLRDVMHFVVGMGMYQQSTIDILSELQVFEEDIRYDINLIKGIYQNANMTIEKILRRLE